MNDKSRRCSYRREHAASHCGLKPSAISLRAAAGRYGGAHACKDLAFESASSTTVVSEMQEAHV
ncbi:MAG TPA: hypothetical protein P5186_28005 [Candidatus Paceibacterota bacterium]|nr:hypothetical protein [Verrucomicrobiota bacterium]HRY51895.1 hypothetical protein [Candidatus Paceibacterota bacterium]